MSKLTNKQQRFVEEYLIDLNATQAAIRAGYSERTARKIGCENLTKPDIEKAIQKAKSERSERTKIDADWVLKEAVKMHRIASGEENSYVIVRESVGDGITQTSSCSLKKTDVAGMGKALEIIGKHVDVSAFDADAQVSVEVKVIDPFKKDEA